MNDHPAKTQLHLSRMAGLALMLFVFMVPIRSVILGHYWSWKEKPFAAISCSTLGCINDSVYLLGVTIVFGLLIVLLRNRPRTQPGVYIAFLVVGLISFFAAVTNIRFIQFFGRPFNYQWLYYSDFLQSVDSHQAMMEEVNPASVSLFMLAFTVMVGMSLFVGKALRAIGQRRMVWAIAVAAASFYLALGGWWANHAIARREWHPAYLENAVLSFFSSFWEERNRPGLFTMKTTVTMDELRPVGERPADLSPLPGGTNQPVRNVIFFVLESVAAQYTEPFGGSHPVTPTMSRYRNQAALFTKFHALAPNTLKSLVSMQASLYPWVSYRFITSEHTDIAVPTLASELKQRGYRTGFFNSADNRFQKMGMFLTKHGVDHVEDWRDRECKHPKIVGSTEEWPFLDGNDDRCTVDYLLRWIDENPGQPFFATMWTIMTHYPYFAIGPQQRYVEDEVFNRYLNGLRQSDEALGLLLEHLERRGLMDSTLVVVVGDHGEAFMQHGSRVHSLGLYDELVRVPMMLIQPRLFSGQEYPTLAGMADLPATILHLMHHPLPAEWQGRSLFSTNRSERVYFFSPWSDYWFGFRDGDQAFFYNASLNRAEMYDMATDPFQKTNLVHQTTNGVPAQIERIAAWIQYQNTYIDKLVKKPRSIEK